jgi:hypothetical protein
MPFEPRLRRNREGFASRPIRLDGQPQADEFEFDALMPVSFRLANCVGGKEIEVLANVEMVLAEVAGRHPQ